MLKLGEINTLIAQRKTDHGFYLAEFDNELLEVLLPNKYVPNNFKEGDDVDVFISKDSENRLVATTIFPKINLNSYAGLEVVSIDKFGVFFDWGLDKNLLVPYSQLGQHVHIGEKYVVYLYLDEKSNRLVGSTKIAPTLERKEITVKKGDQVKVLPFETTEIGYLCVVNNKFQGLLYKNEVFSEIGIGEEYEGFIKKIREDNKIDLSLQPIGYDNRIDSDVDLVMNALQNNNGKLNLHDKSDPQEIQNLLGISKKAFKKAIGHLYKQKQIKIDQSGISLKSKA